LRKSLPEPAIYAIGNDYWTASKTKPTWEGLKWVAHKDQFWAEQAGTTIWKADMNSGEEGKA
jgi:hypothetical protein